MQGIDKVEELVVRCLLRLKHAKITSVRASSLMAELDSYGVKIGKREIEHLIRRGTLLTLKNGRMMLNPRRNKKR